MSESSEVSWSGVLTLVLLITLGPIINGVLWVAKRTLAHGSNNLNLVEQQDSESKSVEQVQFVADSAASPSESASGGELLESDDDPSNLSSMQYNFSLVGFAIGIANVWRFSYVIASDGGSAALFAYIICTVLVATPLMLYEMIIGQYLRFHSFKTWKLIRPRWLGLSIAQSLTVLIVTSYFVMIIAYTIPYLVGSCLDPLPWIIHPEGSEGYWYQNVLVQKPSLNQTQADIEGIQGHLVGSLLLVWTVLYLSVAFGKNLLAKVTYFTVLVPVVLVLVLIIRTSFLPGAGDGIRFYIGKFDGSKLLELDVWARALSQCLFSLGTGFGTILTMSSYAHRHEDIYRAAIITSLANTLFAVAAGFGIFAMLGNLAFTEGRQVEEVAITSGTGLAFITIAAAMPTFGSAANALSVMFFSMLFMLGLDSAFSFVETLTGNVQDIMDELGMKHRPKWLVSLFTCTFTFLIGLVYTTDQGILVLDTFDTYVGTDFLLFLCFAEAVALNIDFGWERAEHALQSATKGKRSLVPFFQCCRFDFHIATPVATLFLFIYQMYTLATSGGYIQDNATIDNVGFSTLIILLALVLFWGFFKDLRLQPQPSKLTPVPATNPSSY